MAKRRTTAPKASWDPETASNYMTEQFTAQSINAASGIENSAVAAVADVGLYLPHLCLRTIFQRTCFPLERSMILFGPTGSNKSALLYWFYWLFCRKYGGKYLHVEVEDKDTPILRLSLLEYDRYAGWIRRCATMDEFQSVVKEYYDWFKAKCSKAGGPGRRVPFVIGIDSLVAKMTEEAANRVAGAGGVTERRFADEARSLSDWFKIAPGYLQKWPFALIAVNHDKPKPGERPGTVNHTTPGGTAPNYYATYKLLVQKVRTLKQQASGWEGNRLRLKMEKCSMATDHREIEVEFVWRMVETPTKTNKTVNAQQSVWNWDKATTEMLYTLVARRDKEGARAAAVADVLGIQKATAGRYYAKALGLGVEDALPPAEFARVLEGRRDVLDVLEPKLGIHHGFPFEQGRDFAEQLEEAAARVDDYVPDAASFAAAVAEPASDTSSESEEATDAEA